MNTTPSRASARVRRSAMPARMATLAISLAVAFGTLPEPVWAQSDTVQLALPAQPLSRALLQLGEQAGWQIFFSQETVAGLMAPAVNGSFAPEEALRRLLAGTDIVFRRTGRNVALSRPTTEGGATLLTPVLVRGTADATTEGSQSYTSPQVTLGKTEQSLREIPQSVSVITRQRLDDQNLATVSQVLENTTGVTLSEVADGGNRYYARGFQMRNVQYDGMPLSRSFYAVGNSFTGGTAHLDRVEVFRGAPGLFEGAGQPGGSINLVRKRGTADTRIAVDARAGSWRELGGMLDVGGALDAEGRLRARAVLDADRSHSFIDVVKERNTNAYLALDYDLTSDTTLGVGVLVSRLRSTPFFGGLPRYADGSSLDLPRSTFLGADWNRWDRNETQFFADLSHQFDEDWRFKLTATHVKESSLTTVLDATGAVDPITLTGPEGTAWSYDKQARHVGVDANLQGRFQTGGIAHTLVVGATWSRLTSTDHIAYRYNVTSIDVFAPNPGIAEPTSFPDLQRTSSYEPHVQKGIYGQLRTELTDKLAVVAGGRVSWFESRFATQATTWSSLSRSSASGEFTPMLGATYAVAPDWTLYASYADIFEAQTATARDGSVLKPIVGANYEAGIKGELMDGRLNTSFALYRIDQTNLAVRDYAGGLVCGGNYCSRAAGKVRSQGFELEASGELLTGLQVAAGYTYNSNEFRRDPERQGEIFSEETPRHLLRLWADYRLPGQWQALRVGGGVQWQSALTNTVSDVRRPSYALWNARVSYDLDAHWTAAVNVNNLFDKTYYQHPGYIENRNNYGAPRQVLFTLRGRF